MSPPRSRPATRLAAAAVLLAAGVACAPGRASAATCGDYVSVGGHAARSAPAADETPDDPPRRPPPCDGPGCSARRPVPGPPLSVPPADPTASDALASGSHGWPGPGGPRRLAPPPSDGVPVSRPGSVFHPPRPA